MAATEARGTVVRRLLRWYFRRASPWVGYEVAIDFGAAASYLEELGKSRPGVTVQTLLAAAVGRALRMVPEANARIVAGRTVQVHEVAVAMPVHLLGQPGETRELSLAFLRDADQLSLVEIADELGRTVQRERRGDAANPALRGLIWLGERLPRPVVDASLTALSWGMEVPAVARAVYRNIPITTMLTNVGSVVRGARGLGGTLIRGGNMQIPPDPIHFATFWGIGPLQEEVIAKEGAPAVAPMLPVVLLFDHRVLDGAKAGELLLRFSEMLSAPAATFGATGDRPGSLGPPTSAPGQAGDGRGTR
jgi:pyruvate/2-oxoglutarate dehydrogenase complex dihydrolipoamide acyltransferase (E2) component